MVAQSLFQSYSGALYDLLSQFMVNLVPVC